MLQQDDQFNNPAAIVREIVTVAAESERQMREKWLRAQTSTPRFCTRHPRTQLVRGDNRRKPTLFDRMQVETLSPGEMEFEAAFFCPDCRCAYALCPPEYLGTSFGTFDISKAERAAALTMARAYADQINRNGCGFAVFSGPPGTGKTRLAVNIVGELRTLSGLYMRQGELLVALRATYGRARYEYDEGGKHSAPNTPLQSTQSAGFLVLDELGCVAAANDERLLLDETLKHRYEQRKPTLLISNLPLAQLKDFLGNALVDRIIQATGNRKFIHPFSGESYRQNIGSDCLEGHG